MENTRERYIMMFETVLKIVSIIVSIGTIVRIIDMVLRHKDKNEHQKSNHTRQS